MCPHSHRGCKWLWSRLRTSGVLIEPWLVWPSATRSHNVYVDDTSQTHRLNTEVKSYELREGISQTWRLCQLLQARGQTASTPRSGAAKWSPVRDALLYCWPNNAPRLAGRSEHGCRVCGDTQRQTAKAVLARLADVVSAHTCCLFLASGNMEVDISPSGLSSTSLFKKTSQSCDTKNVVGRNDPDLWPYVIKNLNCEIEVVKMGRQKMQILGTRWQRMFQNRPQTITTK